MIGFFFLGAISTGIRNNISDKGLFNNKSFSFGIDKKKNKEDSQVSGETEEKISKN